MNYINQITQKITKYHICMGVVGIIGLYILHKFITKRKQIKKIKLLDLIGNTPLIYLQKLSAAAGCHIYAKLQYLNPFGSSKDRAVKQFLSNPKIQKQNYRQIVEASSGSTALSLIQQANIMGLSVKLFLPDDLAQDKYLLLQILKANIVKVPQVSIVDSNHYYNLANKYSSDNQAYFTNQFQNLDNAQAHYKTTGPEIYKQTQGLIDIFICSAGTGGTLAGVSKYLKQKNENIKVILSDPQGSGLYNKVKFNILYTKQQKQGYRLKNPFDTIIEGVGLNRPTANFTQALIDDAYLVTDQQALHMAQYLIQNQGIFVGGSSALNIAAAVKTGQKYPNSNIVTIFHDSGIRYMKKFYSEQYLKDKNIKFEKKKNYQQNDLSFIK